MDWDAWLRVVWGHKQVPRWVLWYTSSFRRSRVVPKDISEGDWFAAKQAAYAICREHGIGPHRRPLLKVEQLVEILEERDSSWRGYEVAPATTQTLPDVDEEDSVRSDVAADGTQILHSSGTIRTLDQLLDAAEFDRSEWYVRSASPLAWTQGKRQAFRVKATLWPRIDKLIRPAPYERDPVEAPILSGPPKTTLVLPDSQNGYRWVGRQRERLEPMHDRRAWDIALQVAADLKPERVLLLGDMVDNAEGSKRWPVGPDLLGTLQPTIDELHWWLKELRDICPTAEIVYLEGNHEDRIDRALISYMKEHSGLCPAGDDSPLVTWRNYLRLDEMGIRYVGPYGERFTLYPDAEAEHGGKHGRAAAAKHLTEATVSIYFGHVHRRQLVSKTIVEHGKIRVVEAGCPGTLARVDGAVPAVSKRVDWQQGLMILTHHAGVT